MRGRPLLLVAALLGLAGAVALLAACKASTDRECFCATPAAVTISAPAGAIAAVKLGGAACADAFPSCFGSSSAVYPPGCELTELFPRSTGACDVEVDLADGGLFRTTIELRDTPTCCGTSPQPVTPEAGALVLPGVDGAAAGR